MPRALRWSLPDIVDFETLLHRDENFAAEQVRVRDAAIFERENTSGDDRPQLLRRWLEARRRADDPGLGARLRESWHLLLVVAALGGCLIGSAVTAGALHYRGTESVNVGWFFALTVLSQWLILALAALAWLLRRTGLLDGFAPLLGCCAGC